MRKRISMNSCLRIEAVKMDGCHYRVLQSCQTSGLLHNEPWKIHKNITCGTIVVDRGLVEEELLALSGLFRSAASTSCLDRPGLDICHSLLIGLGWRAYARCLSLSAVVSRREYVRPTTVRPHAVDDDANNGGAQGTMGRHDPCTHMGTRFPKPPSLIYESRVTVLPHFLKHNTTCTIHDGLAGLDTRSGGVDESRAHYRGGVFSVMSQLRHLLELGKCHLISSLLHILSYSINHYYTRVNNNGQEQNTACPFSLSLP
ncbi:hypothetical protein BR93DRAFT_203948 [Coniochaeta sp. PMI_546]|nr:hypothetical protein BR93DRAFT_203948 [Coniochaeta sp. PMI_546]